MFTIHKTAGSALPPTNKTPMIKRKGNAFYFNKLMHQLLDLDENKLHLALKNDKLYIRTIAKEVDVEERCLFETSTSQQVSSKKLAQALDSLNLTATSLTLEKVALNIYKVVEVN